MDIESPDLPRSPRALAAFSWFATLAGPLAIVVGAATFAGWLLNVPVMRSLWPGLPEMKFNTGLSTLCLGASLSVWMSAPGWRRAGMATAVGALGLPFLTMLQYLLHVDFGIDQLIVSDVPRAIATSHPGRMGLPATLTFQLLAVGLLLAHAAGRLTRAASLLSVAGTVIAFPSTVGYLVGAEDLYLIPIRSAIAPNTSLCLLVCALGLLVSRPLDSFVEPYTASGPGGVTGRLLAPAILLVPLAAGVARRSVLAVAVDDRDLAGAMSIMVVVVLFLVALHRCVLVLNRFELERLSVQHQLLQSQKMESVGMLAGGIAHDFNNLLTVIQGQTAQLLEAPGTVLDQRAALDEIHTAAASAASLTRQLLTFSRKQVVRPQLVDPVRTVETQAVLLRRLLGPNIVLTLELATDAGQISIDPSQLEQVIMNLVVNARDAMSGGGTLRVAARRVPGAPAQVELEVADTGCGIPGSIRPRIFEPFFTTKPRGRGTGLGLSTVFGIVSESRGTIDVTSREGHGTTFRLRFPEAAPAVASVAPAAPPQTARSGGSGLVLLVEDEAAVRRIARTMLRRHGYEVLEAGDGAAALEHFAAQGSLIKVVVTDVVMPGISGVALARALRERGWTRPVVCMSGYPDAVLDEAGPDAAHLLFVPKPFSAESLLAAVRAAAQD